MPKIEPCPFCGSKNVRVLYDRIMHNVNCRECGVSSRSKFSKEDAIKEWNTRPREEELMGAIRKYCVECEYFSASDAARCRECKFKEILKAYEKI